MLRLVLSCVWAALTAGLCYVAVTVKAPQIQEDIRSRTAALIVPQDPKVDVIVDGRFVTLRGLAASESAKSQHLAAANEVYGALGPTDALWLAFAQRATHYLSAEKNPDGSVVLSGVVPTSALRDEIAAAATSVFKDAVTNRVAVSGAAEGDALPPAPKGLSALAALDKGVLLLTQAGVMLSGAASTEPVAAASASLEASQGLPWHVFVAGPAAAASLTAAKTPDGTIEARGAVSSEAAKASVLSALGAGGAKVIDLLTVQSGGLTADWDARALAGASAITKLDWGNLSIDSEKSSLRGAGPQSGMSAIRNELGDAWTKDLIVRAETAELEVMLTTAGTAPPESAAADPAPKQAAACAGGISKLLEAETIKFDPGSAEISKDAFGLIKKLAEAARPCVQSDARSLIISGHTDNQGAPESNMLLSKQRAEAVRRAFAAIGLNESAMAARGFGENQPVADNGSDAGRQANRRIAFDWVSK
jgi:OmpA-OmpF porin, OOP family